MDYFERLKEANPCVTGISIHDIDPSIAYILRNGVGIWANQRVRDERGNYMFIPKITDVEVIDNDSVKVVIVRFEDGTFEKAVQNPDDTYSLEQGISICITKKLISKYTNNETREYNKLIRGAIKTMKNNKKIAEKKAADEQAAKARAEKLIAKKKARKAKLEAEQREREIEIQVEAYRRAMNLFTINAVAEKINDNSVNIKQNVIENKG